MSLLCLLSPRNGDWQEIMARFHNLNKQLILAWTAPER